jgi:hypothetical protein
MLLVPAVFCLLTLLLLWNRWILPRGDVTYPQKWLMLLLAGFFPGMIYYHSAFPVAITTFFIIVHLHAMLFRNWIGAGVAAALAGMAHPMGCPLVGVPVLWALWPRARGSNFTRRDRAGALLACGIGLMGGLGVMLTHRLAVGAWDAYFLVQANFHHRLQTPLASLVYHFHMLRESYRFQPPSHQTLLITVIVLQLLLSSWRRRPLGDLDRLLLILMAIYWMFPLCLSFTSEHRAHATLLPIVLLTRHVPLRTRVLLLGLSIFVAGEMAWRYLVGYLV